MSDVPGYIYALINPSMPGLVKVGCTTRDPAGRADELSGATGVAAPFVVAYHAFFPNMSVAEQQVHLQLEARGFRVASNREFFRAELAEVIKCIGSTPGHNEQPISSGDIASVADALYDKALAHLTGADERLLEDEDEGLEALSQAAKLGHIRAMRALADHYRIEYLVNTREADLKESLRWLKEAIQRGDIAAHGKMARLYRDIGHSANENKCWKAFLNGLISLRPVDNSSDVEPGASLIDYLDTLPIKNRFLTGPQIEVDPEMYNLLRGLFERYRSSALQARVVTDNAATFNRGQELKAKAIRKFLDSVL